MTNSLLTLTHVIILTYRDKAASYPECVKAITYERCKNIIKLFLLSNLNIACPANFDKSIGILILDSKNECNCMQSLLGHAYRIQTLISLPNDRIVSCLRMKLSK
jgi:hypothetical protein